MKHFVMHSLIRAALVLLVAAPGLVGAAEPAAPASNPDTAQQNRLRQRALAAVCANCHGTDGRGVQGSLIPTLAGMPREYMLEQFQDFRDGTRPATVMPQLVKGLTADQMEQLATYFSRIRRLPEDAP